MPTGTYPNTDGMYTQLDIRKYAMLFVFGLITIIASHWSSMLMQADQMLMTEEMGLSTCKVARPESKGNEWKNE